MQLRHPFRVDGHGHVASTDELGHIRQMVEQLLFTDPGERVNRPSFGCGLSRYLFEPISEELVAAAQFLIQSQLDQWMGDIIVVEAVEASQVDSALVLNIRYRVRGTDDVVVETFEG